MFDGQKQPLAHRHSWKVGMDLKIENKTMGKLQ